MAFLWHFSSCSPCRLSCEAEGVRRGDRVSIYLPMVVELPAAMLACARIGAVHSVVFGGFSAESLAGRPAAQHFLTS